MAYEDKIPLLSQLTPKQSAANNETTEQDASVSSSRNIAESSEWLDLNNRIRTDLMAHCFSYLQDDDEARLCVQRVWKKYLRCVGDVGMVQLKRVFLSPHDHFS